MNLHKIFGSGNDQSDKKFNSASLYNNVFLIVLWGDVRISLLQLNMIYEGQ